MNEIIINNDEGTLTVLSTEVAKNFGKEHRNVLKAIEELKKGIGDAEKSADLFIENAYVHPQNKQTYKCYNLTRDGFSLLVMGFTGKKALTWKLKYIEAFNLMEVKLKNPTMLNDSLKKELNEVKECLNHMIELYKDQSKRVERLENTKALETSKRFVPPTAQEVEDYCDRLGEYIDADRFVDYYQSIGWLVGNKPMKDWKATVRNWIRTQRY